MINGLGYRVLIKTFLARFRYLFRFNEILSPYEKCNRCGLDYCLCINVEDEKWIEVNGKDEGCLCIDCFLKIAKNKRIEINLDDFEQIWVFDSKGKSFDIINNEMCGSK